MNEEDMEEKLRLCSVSYGNEYWRNLWAGNLYQSIITHNLKTKISAKEIKDGKFGKDLANIAKNSFAIAGVLVKEMKKVNK